MLAPVSVRLPEPFLVSATVSGEPLVLSLTVPTVRSPVPPSVIVLTRFVPLAVKLVKLASIELLTTAKALPVLTAAAGAVALYKPFG